MPSPSIHDSSRSVGPPAMMRAAARRGRVIRPCQAWCPGFCRCRGSRCLHDHRTALVLALAAGVAGRRAARPPAGGGGRPRTTSSARLHRGARGRPGRRGAHTADVAVAQTPALSRRGDRADEVEAGGVAMVEQFTAAGHRGRRAAGKSVDALSRPAAAGDRADARAGDSEPQGVPGPAHRGREGARPDATELRSQVRRCATPARRCAARPRPWSRRCASRRSAAPGARPRSRTSPAGRHGRALRLRPAGDRAPSDGQTQRPDMRVHLADGKHVFVDSKVPLAAFLDAAETEDEQQKAAHLATRSPATCAPTSTSCPASSTGRPPSPPSSSCCSCPARSSSPPRWTRCPTSTSTPSSKDVVIATPTTLIGMLRAISYGWKQAALADKAAEVFKLGRELHERLGTDGQPASTSSAGRSTSAVNAYNETDRHGREPGAGLGASVPRPPGQRGRARAAPAVEAPVRQIQAAGAGRGRRPGRPDDRPSSPTGPRRGGARGGRCRGPVERRGPRQEA